jgi:DNA-binding transcriptional ArsR family regulator
VDAALKALAEPRRREILRLVWADELQAGAIHDAMPDVTFGAVSLQLRTLIEVGAVEVRSEGRHRFYRARRQALKPVADILEQMWGDALCRLKVQAELEETRRGPRPRSRRQQKRFKWLNPASCMIFPACGPCLGEPVASLRAGICQEPDVIWRLAGKCSVRGKAIPLLPVG